MNVNVGTDLVLISRIAALSDAAKSKVFHPNELKNATSQHLAGVFAVKECCKKIFGPKISWKSVEVKRVPGGAPQILLSSVLRNKVQAITASTSHEGGYAIAFVVAVMK